MPAIDRSLSDCRYIAPPTYSPLTASWDANGRRLTDGTEEKSTLKLVDGSVAQTPAVEEVDDITGAKAGQTELKQLEEVMASIQTKGKLSAEQVSFTILIYQSLACISI